MVLWISSYLQIPSLPLKFSETNNLNLENLDGTDPPPPPLTKCYMLSLSYIFTVYTVIHVHTAAIFHAIFFSFYIYIYIYILI